MPLFKRHIGIDYSGAGEPSKGCKGLRVYVSDEFSEPKEHFPPAGKSKYWNRISLASWLKDLLSTGPRTVVGIDHGFSFPSSYFEQHNLQKNWHSFLDDFCGHWPSAQHSIKSIRSGEYGRASARSGNSKWYRRTEKLSKSAKSVFHFDVNGQVAASTHSGIPWLREIRDKTNNRVHFWPFDGWKPESEKSVIVEVYPRLWSMNSNSQLPPGDQRDAYCVAEWLRNADRDDKLLNALQPKLCAEDQRIAQFEGWILGVPSPQAVTEDADSEP